MSSKTRMFFAGGVVGYESDDVGVGGVEREIRELKAASVAAMVLVVVEDEETQ